MHSSRHGINLKVSKIELAYDFYTLSAKDRIKLYDFLKSHVFLRNSRSKPSETKSFQDVYLRTFYFNQLKRSSKGLKEYIRQDRKSQWLVRLELTFKRQALKKLGIDPSLKTIDAVDPFRFFTFMSLDETKLMDYLKRKSRRTNICVDPQKKQ